MADIFVSYKSEDREHAECIAALLEENGYSVWWDHELLAGQRWGKVIKAELDAASCVVVLWTSNSIDPDQTYASDWVEREAEEAYRRGVLIPALFNAEAVPWIHKSIEWAPLFEWDGTDSHPSFADLLASIQSLVGEASPVNGDAAEPKAVSMTSILSKGFNSALQAQKAPVKRTLGLPASQLNFERSIVALTSGRGGVGKTWLSTTLAACFARSGCRTLLIDGDLANGNLGSHLNVSTDNDLLAVLFGWLELKSAITPIQGGANSSEGFDFLAAASKSDVGHLTNDAIDVVGMSDLWDHYDQVIVDLDAGLEDNVMRLARACNKCIIVATDDPSSMTDAYASIKVLRGYAPAVQAWIAVNLAETRVAGRRTYEAIARASQHFLGFRPPLAGVILRDPKVREAVRQQKTVIAIDPQAQSAIDVQSAADTLLRSGT
jgi:flagellar biosynthesis protein FlhG